MSLNLAHAPITDAGLATLRTLTDLRDLNLWWCEGITDAGIEHLAALPHLRSLDLGRCAQITDACMSHLRELTGLRTLGLAETRITDSGLAALTP